MTDKLMKIPKGYRLMRPGEKPDWKKKDKVCEKNSIRWFITMLYGRRTLKQNLSKFDLKGNIYVRLKKYK